MAVSSFTSRGRTTLIKSTKQTATATSRVLLRLDTICYMYVLHKVRVTTKIILETILFSVRSEKQTEGEIKRINLDKERRGSEVMK